MRNSIKQIYKSKNQFILIGLTGKTGSGSSTVANILENGYKDYQAVNEKDKYIQQKKDRIIKNYASIKFKNKKFNIIKPSALIMMIFILGESVFTKEIKKLQKLLDNIKDIENDENIKNKHKKINKDIKSKCKDISEMYKLIKKNNLMNYKFLKDDKFFKFLNNYNNKKQNELLLFIKEYKKRYEKRISEQNSSNFIKEISSTLNTEIDNKKFKKNLKKFKIIKIIEDGHFRDKIKNKINLKSKIINNILEKMAKEDYDKFIKLYNKFDKITRKLRKSNSKKIKILQNIGDSVRENAHIYELPKYINFAIKALRAKSKNENKDKNKYCYIVIDSLKNPFEIVYFKERYSAYYTFSMHSNDQVIYDRFKKRKINIKEIHKRELYKPNTKKQKDSLDNKEDFNSQNIIECIQRSDIYIDNNRDKKDNLYKQIFKYLSLIIHPGLITPTKDEIMMQLALNAKFNSGCISRQVGAVVLNKYDSIKSIGWNDVPEGQIPCNLRSHSELLNNSQLLDYSDYEKSKVRNHKHFKNIFFKKRANQYKRSNKIGLNDSFCFKQIQNKIDKNSNQVYTRSLHAEENAFLQLAKYGNSKILGGQLFTTSSPCFLCAKKAYQLGIRRIVYIEAYPDISNDQIFSCGFKETEVIHFRGTIGLAYQKLFEPLFSYKDELNAINSSKIK
ncbi:MAG: hypothetical protein DRG78_03620 [Epsilonproteobacteria bacterium]|nr:MAG: hypothetical protein DRG78_03620 [Campylobacterota bacterium]